MPHSEISEVIAPRSQFYHGPYGRMFRNLPPHVPTFKLIKALSIEGENKKLTKKIKIKIPEIPQNSNSSLRVFVKTVGDARKIWKQFKKIKDQAVTGHFPEETRGSILKILARTMIETPKQSLTDSTGNNPEIPAGYTYFGQFITHDITFDPTSSLMRFNDPNKLRNFRTPRLDLDSLYGGGPDDTPFMYEHNPKSVYRKYFLLVGRGEYSQEADLPRNLQGRALIGDPRNDENVMISQLQLAFIKFHNKIVTRLVTDGLKPEFAFGKAQQMVRWHYQWVVLHDYLPRFVDHKILEKIWKVPGCSGQPKLRYYRWRNQPFIPVEFAVAAFRFGHSMIRSEYHLNKDTLKLTLHPKGHESSTQDLRGFSHLPKGWSINWNHFFKLSKQIKPQPSRRIDTRLSDILGDFPPALGGGSGRSLATLDLLRGYKMGLPSGQTIALAMGEKPLAEPEEPLLFYILREAQELHKGRKLGPVGGRIVAEVIIGLVAGDPHSFLNVNPGWRPTYQSIGKNFELRDILHFVQTA